MVAKIIPLFRHKARRIALQALYQWQLAGENLSEIEAQFHTEQSMNKVDTDYFHELLHEIPKHLDEIDELAIPHLDRPLEELNVIELTAIRIGCYELKYRIDIPYKVAINEAVEITKTFGTVDGYKYVNGVLDKIAGQVRAEEIKAR